MIKTIQKWKQTKKTSSLYIYRWIYEKHISFQWKKEEEKKIKIDKNFRQKRKSVSLDDSILF